MRKLPVWDAFNQALASTLNNMGFALRTSWGWMLLLVPFHIAWRLFLVPTVPLGAQAGKAQALAMSLPISAITMLAFASIAVNWHRYMLLGETPKGLQIMRLDWPVWRYVGNLILMILMGIVAETVFGLATALLYVMFGKFSFLLIIPAVFAALFFAIAFFYRLGCKLPGVAIGNEIIGFGDVLNATQHNNGRFFGLALLTLLVTIIVSVVLLGISYGATKAVSGAFLPITIAFQLLLNWVYTMFGVTILSTLYSFFIERREIY